MDLRQIEYILAIEREQSISRAAESLFMTQSALNQQLLKLERELGTPLFERQKHNMTPTFAGKKYLSSAHRIVDIKKETYKTIQDIVDEVSGEISISFTPEVGATMFAHVYPVFHRKYPNVSFKIYEERMKRMEQLLLKKKISLAALSYFDFNRNYELTYIDMDQEPMILGLPITHPLAHLAGEKSYETLPTIDLKLLKDTRFILLSSETLMRVLIDMIFSEADFSPHVLFETASTRTAIHMVKQQICAAFFPHSYVDPDAPIAYFTVEPCLKWHRSMAFLKGAYLSKPEKYFIELAIKYHQDKLSSELLPYTDL